MSIKEDSSFVQPDEADELVIVWTLLASLTVKGSYCCRRFQVCLLGGGVRLASCLLKSGHGVSYWDAWAANNYLQI